MLRNAPTTRVLALVPAALLVAIGSAPALAQSSFNCAGAACAASSPDQTAVRVTSFAPVIDPVPVSAPDSLMRNLVFSGASLPLDHGTRPGPWFSGTMVGGPVPIQGDDAQDFSEIGFSTSLGFGLDPELTPFLGFSRGTATTDDGHDISLDVMVVGVSGTGTLSNRLTWGAVLYAGQSKTQIESTQIPGINGAYKGTLVGTTLRGTVDLGQLGPRTRLDLRVQGDVLRHQTDDYGITGQTTSQIKGRTLTSYALRVELGLPTDPTESIALRPYLAFTAADTDQEGFTVLTQGASTFVEASDVLSGQRWSLGATVSMAQTAGLRGRVEASSDDKGRPQFGLSVGLAF